MAVRIAENFLILYYGSIFIIETFLLLVFLVNWKKRKSYQPAKPELPLPGISILVPAFNEAATIVPCVKSLLRLNYDQFEVLVINDGSTDETLAELIDAFELEQRETFAYRDNLGTLKPRRIFVAKSSPHLTVIDKENGGKADALNVGLNMARFDFCCSIDADSILDAESLKLIVLPFLGEKGESVALAGGALAVANGSVFRDDRIDAGDLPQSMWVRFQAIEYLRSFWVNRIGLSQLNLLLILSGAFTLFRKKVVMDVGGFYSRFSNNPYIIEILKGAKGTVCEDMEIVVRIRRYLREKKLPDKAVFIPWPICWTEVPETSAALARQRNRWHRGLLETIWYHRKIMFEPKYGRLGLVAMPYYLIFEALGPIVKTFTYVFIAYLVATGRIHDLFFLLLTLSVVLIGMLGLGIATVTVESWSRKNSPTHLRALRYRTGREWLKLLVTALYSELAFGFVRNFWQLAGIRDFLKGIKNWGKSSRIGLRVIQSK